MQPPAKRFSPKGILASSQTTEKLSGYTFFTQPININTNLYLYLLIFENWVYNKEFGKLCIMNKF